MIEHNITLIFDFLRQAVKDPSIIDDIEDNSIIEFIENDRPIIESKKTKKPDRYYKVKHQFEKVKLLSSTEI